MEITDNMLAVLRYLESKCKSGKKVIAFSDIAEAMGVTKATARANAKRLYRGGYISMVRQYNYKDKLPHVFSLTKSGKDLLKQHEGEIT